MKRILLSLAVFIVLFPAAAGAQGQPAPAPAAEPNPYAKVPQEFFDEADQHRAYCEKTPNYRKFYNCDCASFEYLDERVRRPGASRSSIILAISNKCFDASEAAGSEYQQCIKNAPMMPAKIPIEEYCECMANTYIKSFERMGRSPDSKNLISLKTQAYVSCRNPELGKKLYPYVPAPKKK